tara:strand:+ start:102 stop:344 length:243 start_codon:yes stop_codon:yes gene_type:complete
MNESGEQIPCYDCDCGFFAYYMKAVVNNKEINMNTKHNQHVIDSLNHECDKRIKELDSDSPHGDYIYYSFQDAINEEKEV